MSKEGFRPNGTNDTNDTKVGTSDPNDTISAEESMVIDFEDDYAVPGADNEELGESNEQSQELDNAQNDIAPSDNYDDSPLLYKTTIQYSYGLMRQYEKAKSFGEGEKTLLDRKKWSFLWLAIGVALIMFGMTIGGIAIASICPLQFLMTILTDRLQQKRRYQNSLSRWNTEAEIDLYEDYINYKSQYRERKYSYDEVKKLYEDDERLYLDTRKDVIIIPKSDEKEDVSGIVEALKEMFRTKTDDFLTEL